MDISSLFGPTTINVGSTAGLPGHLPGVLNGIVGAVLVVGSRFDTLNVDDTGDTRNQTGTLTDKKLTGLGMGQGITYSGLRNLNVYLGSGDDTFAINEIYPLTKTLVDGGGGNDRVTATFQQDFQGDLTLRDFEAGTVQVGRDLGGRLRDLAPGANLQSVNVGRSVAAAGQFLAQGDVGTLTVGQDVAGHVEVDGNLDTATVLGSVLSATGSTILVGHNLGRLTVGQVVNNQPVPGNVSGVITVQGDFDTGYVYGSVSGLISVGGNLTSLLKVIGDVSGTVAVTGNVAELDTRGSQSGLFTAGGDVTLLEIRTALTGAGRDLIHGNLWSLLVGLDSGNPGNGLFGQVVVGGNLFQAQVVGAMTGTLGVNGDVGVADASGGQLTRYGGVIVDGPFGGQIVALGNAYGDFWFKRDDTGRVAVRGQPIAGQDAQRFGILGNVRVDGQIGANAALVSGGEIADAAFGTQLTANGIAGILAAEGAMSFGSVGDTSGASIFQQASGVNAAAIDAIFTNLGNPLAIDTTPQGLSNLALILADLAALHVGSDGNLTGPIP
jgi:hypothetical protein